MGKRYWKSGNMDLNYNMDNKAKVLLYNIDESKLNLIKNYFDENDIDFIIVERKDYLKPIVYLLDLDNLDDNYEDYLKEEFENDMALLYNFDNELLDSFLKYFRDNKIPGIRLKAVFTDTNANWNSVELYNELVKEAEYFRKKNNLN